jgi:hypothetical protein
LPISGAWVKMAAMACELVVQRLSEATWEDMGVTAGETPQEIVARVAPTPGIYRSREPGSDGPWRFLYVNEDGQAIDSGAVSRL